MKLWRDRTEQNPIPLFWDLFDAVLFVIALDLADGRYHRRASHRKAAGK